MAVYWDRHWGVCQADGRWQSHSAFPFFPYSVEVELGRARVLRDGGIVQCGYQSSNRLRVLHIDLIGSGGKAVEIPRCMKSEFSVVTE